ncbi:MAG: GNAT family N-acetyltransferase [Cyclobacteriaceae bacterium]
MFNIHVANEKDIPAITHIAENTWWPTYSPILPSEQIRYMLDEIYSVETLSKAMSDGSETFLLVQDETGYHGFASFGLRKEDVTIYKLHKIYVFPESHGKGYGKILIEEVKSRMRKDHIFCLDLNVNRFNPARTFYEKLGFRILREEDVPVGPYWMNDYVMRLELKV